MSTRSRRMHISLLIVFLSERNNDNGTQQWGNFEFETAEVMEEATSIPFAPGSASPPVEIGVSLEK